MGRGLVLLVGRTRGDDDFDDGTVNATPLDDGHCVTVVPFWEHGDGTRVS